MTYMMLIQLLREVSSDICQIGTIDKLEIEELKEHYRVTIYYLGNEERVWYFCK